MHVGAFDAEVIFMNFDSYPAQPLNLRVCLKQISKYDILNTSRGAVTSVFNDFVDHFNSHEPKNLPIYQYRQVLLLDV